MSRALFDSQIRSQLRSGHFVFDSLVEFALCFGDRVDKGLNSIIESFEDPGD